MAALTITVDGRLLSRECLYGDVEMSTVWPGGSDELSWTVTGYVPSSLARGGAAVRAYVGPLCVWGGTLLEPDPSQEQMTAQGLWRLGDQYAALDGSGSATAIPDVAIDQAIARGLPWARPTSIKSTSMHIDITQGPVTVGQMLDTWAANNGYRWGVDPTGVLHVDTVPTVPTYRTLPIEGGLGYALDNYASTLVGRYQTSTGYATQITSDTEAANLHGYREAVVDITDRGVITSTIADGFLAKLLADGRSRPQWTAPIAFSQGELLSLGATPVALETVAAGPVVRVHGGTDLARANSGHLYVDVPIGHTSLSDGVLTVQSAQPAIRTFVDMAAAALAKKK